MRYIYHILPIILLSILTSQKGISQTGDVVFSKPHSKSISGGLFKGQLLATYSYNEIKIWETEDFKLLKDINVVHAVKEIHISDDQQWMLINTDNQKYVWDLFKNKEVISIETPCTLGPHGLLASVSPQEDSVVILSDIKSSKRVFTLRGANSKIHSVTFSPSGKLLSGLSKNGELIIWDTSNGKKVSSFHDTINELELNVSKVFFSKNDSLIVRKYWHMVKINSVFDKKLEFEVQTNQMDLSQLSLSNSEFTINIIASSELNSTSKTLLMILNVSEQDQYSTKVNIKIPIAFDLNYSAEPLFILEKSDACVFNHTGDQIYRTNGSTIEAYSLDGNIVNKSDLKKLLISAKDSTFSEEPRIGEMIVNQKGNMLLCGYHTGNQSDYSSGALLLDANKLSLVNALGSKFDFISKTMVLEKKTGLLTSIGSSLVMRDLWSFNTLYRFDTNDQGNTGSYAISPGMNYFSAEGLWWRRRVENFGVSKDSKFILTLSNDRLIKVWDLNDGKFKYSLSGNEFSLSKNQSEINVDGKLFSIESGTRLNKILSKDDKDILMLDTIKGFIIKTLDGQIVIKDNKDSTNYVTITSFDSSSEYTIIHSSGLFDTSKEGGKYLYFVQNLATVELNQLKARFYEPGLLQKFLNRSVLRKAVGFRSIDLPPKIELDPIDNKGNLRIKLINQGGGIGKVTVYINGKETIEDARYKNFNPKTNNAVLTVYVGNHKNLIKGNENFVAVKAWNSDNWVVSKGKIISYNDKEIESYKPSVYIFSCGVSDYSGPEIDLKYAAKDAEDFSKAIQLGAKHLFGTEKSFEYTLTTDRSKEFYPTKSNILKTLETISTAAHPLDVFVMYISGHGINYGGQDGDWHYLTQEAYTGNGAAYNDPAIRKQTTISSNELVELFKKVPALKQVLIIDACASGRVVENLMTQKDISSSTLRALDRMRDRTGMHIITGCTADAVSYEASKYGQGVLTYSLLEGIRGAALREDKFIDINKLFQYAHDRVPLLAEGIGGIQTPQVFSPQGAQSFDIGLLTEAEKKDIPIAKIRPVYIRSNFQDENELEDILGLGKIIDESLNEVSSRGKDANLIFVDVKEYPDGCKLIGRYQKVDGKINLKLRKKCGEESINYEIKADNIDQLKLEILKVL